MPIFGLCFSDITHFICFWVVLCCLSTDEKKTHSNSLSKKGTIKIISVLSINFIKRIRETALCL